MAALQDYRCVIALLDARHFGRAADRLGVTQPALTARLRRLEAELQVRLFERGRAGVEPTAAGLVFAEGAQRVLDAAEEAAEAALGVQQGYGQTLRIGMTQIAAYQVVPRSLAAFRAENPMARVRLVEGTTASLEAMLEQRRIDAAFLHPPLHAADLSEKMLTTVALARFNAGDDSAGDDSLGDALIRYPRSEAPVLMAALGRQQPADEGHGRGPAEADTMLGAAVLSQAGYGAFVAPVDFPQASSLGVNPARGKARQGDLETSLAWRSLDRRPVIRSLIHAVGLIEAG